MAALNLAPVPRQNEIAAVSRFIPPTWFDWFNTLRTMFLLLNGRVVFDAFNDPNGNVTAPIGTLYSSLTNGSLWSKTSGTGNTVWTAR